MIFFYLIPWNIVAFVVFDVLVSLTILESHLVIELGWRRVLPHDYILGIMVYRLLRVGHMNCTASPLWRVVNIFTSCKYLLAAPI